MKYPDIKTSLPGPRASGLVAIDQIYISPSYTRLYPLVAEKAKGVWIWDVDGNRFLDFTAGVAVCSTGHCHPKVVEAIKNQAGRLIHMAGTDFYYETEILLAKKLDHLAPYAGEGKVFFGNSGTEAIEAAFKLARWHSRRELNLAFLGSFHGRTMGSLSLTASKTVQREHFYPLVPGVFHVPYPYCYRCPFKLTHPQCGLACVDFIENTLFKTVMPPEQVAAIFVETIQGEGGYIVPPPEFHARLYELAKKYGILYVVDEVQSGMGRTGKMFAIEHFGVEPDMVAAAKGIASGMPLGAVMARAEIMDWEFGSHGSTFGGNPVSCAAALATIELLETDLISNASTQGDYLIKKLKELQLSLECLGDVRGKGLMVGVELVKDRETKEPAIEWRKQLIQTAFHKGLLLLGCGENSVRFSPALTVTREEIDVCLSLFEEAVREVTA